MIKINAEYIPYNADVKTDSIFETHGGSGHFGIAFVDGALYQMSRIESYGHLLDVIYPDITWNYIQTADYQGYWFAVGYDRRYWYYHSGEYGSCSGCDALLGLDTPDGALEFLNSMRQIILTDSQTEMIRFLKDTAFNWGEDTSEEYQTLIKLSEWVANGRPDK